MSELKPKAGGFTERRESVKNLREHYWSLDKPELVELLVMRDAAIRIRDRHVAELIHRFNHDGLTGALSRDGLGYVLDDWRKRRQAGCMLFIDLDKFKLINDKLGHDKGDETLVRVTKVLKRSTRTEDSVGRWGGDEFGILLPEATLAIASSVAVRAQSDLLNEYGDEYQKYGSALIPTLSVGIATANYSLPRNKMFSEADAAMYQAKEAGGDTISFAPSLHLP